jgi:hypothetical protein
MSCCPGWNETLPPDGAAAIVAVLPAIGPVANECHVAVAPPLAEKTSSEQIVAPAKPLVSAKVIAGVIVPNTIVVADGLSNEP